MANLIGNVARKEKRDTAASWTSNNPIPLAGEWCLETDTGNIKIGDGTSSWADIGYYVSLPETYDISAANTVIALPNISGLVQRKTYYWTGGDGTYTFSFTVSDAATIGGELATGWIGEGEGTISLESDGSNWQVADYEDSGTIADSGVETKRSWVKFKNNIMKIIGTSSYSGIALTTSDEGMFRNSPGSALPSYGKAFTAIATQFRVFSESVSFVSGSGVSSGQTVLLGSALFWTGVSTASSSPSISWEAIGPWR